MSVVFPLIFKETVVPTGIAVTDAQGTRINYLRRYALESNVCGLKGVQPITQGQSVADVFAAIGPGSKEFLGVRCLPEDQKTQLVIFVQDVGNGTYPDVSTINVSVFAEEGVPAAMEFIGDFSVPPYTAVLGSPPKIDLCTFLSLFVTTTSPPSSGISLIDFQVHDSGVRTRLVLAFQAIP